MSSTSAPSNKIRLFERMFYSIVIFMYLIMVQLLLPVAGQRVRSSEFPDAEY